MVIPYIASGRLEEKETLSYMSDCYATCIFNFSGLIAMDKPFIDKAWHDIELQYNAKLKGFRVRFLGQWTVEQRNEFFRMFLSFNRLDSEDKTSYVYLQE